MTSLRLSRRSFLGATFIAGVMVAAPASTVDAYAATGDVVLTADGIKVIASIGGRIAIYSGSMLLLYGSKFQTKDSVAGTQLTVGGTPSLVEVDGAPAIRMDYTLPTAAAGQTVYALITVTTRHAHIEWHITGPATLRPEGFMFSRAVQNPTAPEEYVALTKWVRDAGGGVPYEVNVGVALADSWADDQHGLLVLARSRQDWTNGTWVHAPATSGPDGDWVTAADFYLSSLRPNATACVGTGTDIGVELWTDRPYNLFDPGTAVRIHYQVANGAPADRLVDLQWWVRDYNGQELVRSSARVTVPGAGVAQHAFTIDAPAYGLAVVEVSARDGDQEALARTNLAVLPPVTNTRGAQSMFGIANYPWLLKPSADDLLDLWQRVGISRVRISYEGGPGLPPAAFDARGILHELELQPDLTATDGAAAAWAAATVDTAVASGATYLEVGNEVNRPIQSGQTAGAYVAKALRPVHERRAATGAPVQIMSMGIAGPDVPWITNFHAAGGWELLDAVTFHAGRGNFTPDYIPPGDPTTWDPSTNGTYWNFLGTLRLIKQFNERYGAKELWMTEAYACTRPNYWWSDTYRHAAENVFLTLALAKAEGVRCVLWYQFFDSMLNLAQVANPDNPEYHFGLIHRDLSVKPSLLAYATAARLLDEATFVRWLTFADGSTHGLLFDTAQGPLSVLWNRSDGYILNADHPADSQRFAAPEVWQDPWPTKVRLRAPAVGSSVTGYDAIGQSTSIPSTDGLVDLTLDGSPRTFLGVDFGTAQAAVPRSNGPVSVKPQLVNGEVSVAVYVRNDGRTPADIRIITAYGQRKFTRVAARSACYALIPSGETRIGAGEVTAAIYHRSHGDPRYQRISVDYLAFPLAAEPA